MYLHPSGHREKQEKRNCADTFFFLFTPLLFAFRSWPRPDRRRWRSWPRPDRRRTMMDVCFHVLYVYVKCLCALKVVWFAAIAYISKHMLMLYVKYMLTSMIFVRSDATWKTPHTPQKGLSRRQKVRWCLDRVPDAPKLPPTPPKGPWRCQKVTNNLSKEFHQASQCG